MAEPDWEDLMDDELDGKLASLQRTFTNNDQGILDELEDDLWEEEPLVGFEEGAERASDAPFEGRDGDA